MKLRNALSVTLLAAAMIIAPNVQAQEKPFTEQQVVDMVHAGLGNDSGAKLIVQRGIDFTPTSEFLKHLKSAGAKDAFLKALRANKPLSQEQVTAMVRAAVGEDSGAQMITQRGIDFAPTEAYIESLKAAGAKEVFIKAVRARMPLNPVQIIAQLAAEAPSQRVSGLVTDRGTDFQVKDEFLQQVRGAGGDDDLISALKSARVMEPAVPDPAAQARQAAVLQHVAKGAELKRKGQYAAAEQEFRASLTPGAPDADIDLSLAMVLGREQKWDDDVAAAREAVSLNPNNGMAHIVLGAALAGAAIGMVRRQNTARRCGSIRTTISLTRIWAWIWEAKTIGTAKSGRSVRPCV